jgi:dynamin-binding protein
MPDSPIAERSAPTLPPGISPSVGEEPNVLFTAASVYEFNIDRARQEGGIPYLTYVVGEIFDVIGERGELWLARNQDDPSRQVGWIWCKHFATLKA